MLIGVPKEIKDHEQRVSMTPDGVRLLREIRASGVGGAVSRSRAAGFQTKPIVRPVRNWLARRKRCSDKRN